MLDFASVENLHLEHLENQMSHAFRAFNFKKNPGIKQMCADFLCLDVAFETYLVLHRQPGINEILIYLNNIYYI